MINIYYVVQTCFLVLQLTLEAFEKKSKKKCVFFKKNHDFIFEIFPLKKVMFTSRNERVEVSYAKFLQNTSYADAPLARRTS